MITVFIGRDNITLLELLEDGEVVQEFAATRAVLWLPASAADSSSTPVVFDTDTDNDIELVANATQVEIQGGQRDLRPGTYTGYLTVYDNPHPNGIAWTTEDVHVRTWRVD